MTIIHYDDFFKKSVLFFLKENIIMNNGHQIFQLFLEQILFSNLKCHMDT